MKRKTVFTVFGLLIVLSMLLSACAKAEGPAVPATEAPATEAPAVEAPAVSAKDTFIFGRGADSVNWIPPS